MSLLIFGGTGTLGRQIVLRALTKGYPVRCLVRNFRKATFLKEWGAELIYGDLSIPETIPPCFQGITAVIDASTSRPSDSYPLETVDWYGKIALIEAAKIAKVQRFIFCSIQNPERFPTIPLMRIKHAIEIHLQHKAIPYTVFRFTGFYQALIEQYAIPTLENLPIWLTNEKLGVSCIDTQDAAKFCLRALQLPDTKNKTFCIQGPGCFFAFEIIALCESFTGQLAKVYTIPVFLLELLTECLGFFEWGQNISDRLAFIKLVSANKEYNPLRHDLNKIFKIQGCWELSLLDNYLALYYVRLVKRLTGLNFEDLQKQKNLII
jgi:uncharacterized protein YbjT (DUF2867 family)